MADSSQITKNSGDISLVEVATIFVRRKWIFFFFFGLFFIGGLSYALITTERYEYESLYQIAELASGESVERPAKALAVLQAQILPELSASYQELGLDGLPVGVEFDNPAGTNLIKLSTEAPTDLSSDVTRFHRDLMGELSQRHMAVLKRNQENLTSRLQSVKQSIDALKIASGSELALVDMLRARTEIEEELSAMKESEVIATARQSAVRVHPNRKLIMLFAVFVGAMLGIFAVYFAEFASIVKRSLSESSS